MGAGRPLKISISKEKKNIDICFDRVKDEYDLLFLVGKLSAQYEISMEAKDALKTIVRECVDFGYNLAMEEVKNGKI
jgi:hypothetical protein